MKKLKIVRTDQQTSSMSGVIRKDVTSTKSSSRGKPTSARIQLMGN